MECKVLIVDDDPIIRRKTKEILDRHQISACAVESGLACIEKFQNGFRGLVLMDASMPELDGWDTVAKLVEDGYMDRAVICMLTGQSEPSSKMASLKEYVIDYILKPFSIQDLVSTVQNYVSYFHDHYDNR